MKFGENVLWNPEKLCKHSVFKYYMIIWRCFKMKTNFQYKDGADVVIDCDDNYNRHISAVRRCIWIGPYAPLSFLYMLVIIHPITEEGNGKTLKLSFSTISNHLTISQGHLIWHKKCPNAHFKSFFYKYYTCNQCTITQSLFSQKNEFDTYTENTAALHL